MWVFTVFFYQIAFLIWEGSRSQLHFYRHFSSKRSTTPATHRYFEVYYEYVYISLILNDIYFVKTRENEEPPQNSFSTVALHISFSPTISNVEENLQENACVTSLKSQHKLFFACWILCRPPFLFRLSQIIHHNVPISRNILFKYEVLFENVPDTYQKITRAFLMTSLQKISSIPYFTMNILKKTIKFHIRIIFLSLLQLKLSRIENIFKLSPAVEGWDASTANQP